MRPTGGRLLCYRQCTGEVGLGHRERAIGVLASRLDGVRYGVHVDARLGQRPEQAVQRESGPGQAEHGQARHVCIEGHARYFIAKLH